MPKILHVEDDPIQQAVIKAFLEHRGFTIETADDAKQALQRFETADLLLLDCMLPDQDGFAVAQTIRRTDTDLPILMLTALDEDEDRIAGLESGVDDYLVKPVNLRELELRLRILLRRAGWQQEIRYGPLAIFPYLRRVEVLGHEVPLTPLRFDLFWLLARSPGRVFSREEILAKVWPDQGSEVTERAVDVRITELRKALSQAGCPNCVQTVRGYGYSFAEPQEAKHGGNIGL